MPCCATPLPMLFAAAVLLLSLLVPPAAPSVLGADHTVGFGPPNSVFLSDSSWYAVTSKIAAGTTLPIDLQFQAQHYCFCA